MKILVTGAAGFIGTNFVYYELDKHPQDKIVALDLLTYAGNIKNLEPLFKHANFSFVQIDINDTKSLEDLFKKEKFDYVVNFAAESHVDRSIIDPQIFLRTNILGTANLMDMCLKYHVKRFHQISTDEVYGDLPLERKDLFFVETTPLHTSSPYSSSKASADLLVGAYVRTYDLDATITRCSNNYGPFQFPEKLIPLMIYNAYHDKPLPVYGKGINVRDWLHVYDHCCAIDLVLRKAKKGAIYNVGGHNEKANIEIVKQILSLLNKSENLIHYVSDRKGHDLRYAIDPTKIKNDLGWQPLYTFEKGLKETLEWYLAHQEWLENIINGDYQNYYQKMYGDRLCHNK